MTGLRERKLGFTGARDGERGSVEEALRMPGRDKKALPLTRGEAPTYCTYSFAGTSSAQQVHLYADSRLGVRAKQGK